MPKILIASKGLEQVLIIYLFTIMKKIKLNGKLGINKETISKLNDKEMENVNGGIKISIWGCESNHKSRGGGCCCEVTCPGYMPEAQQIKIISTITQKNKKDKIKLRIGDVSQIIKPKVPAVVEKRHVSGYTTLSNWISEETVLG